MSIYLSKSCSADVKFPGVFGYEEQAERAYLVAVLDGSPEFAESHREECALQKERLHREECHKAIEACGGTVRFPFQQFRDAEFGEFEGADALHLAIAAALKIHRQLGLWNLEHQLGWTDQFHSRAVVARVGWNSAIDLLPQALRGDLVIQPSAWEDLSTGEQGLLRMGTNARRGASLEEWEEVNAQLEEGITLPDASAEVTKRVERYRLATQLAFTGGNAHIA